MTRSIPLEKIMRDAMLAYGQNGQAIGPEQGYPLRLLLPGYEGNTNIKWLRRLELSREPFMTREETSSYTDLMPSGKAWQFVFVMDAKSVITFPSGEMRLPGPGYYDVIGLAWSGRGRITTVEVSVDGGASWSSAQLDAAPQPICTVRFSLPWAWEAARRRWSAAAPTRPAMASRRARRWSPRAASTPITTSTGSKLGASVPMGASAVRRLEVRSALVAGAWLLAGLIDPALAAPPVPSFGTSIGPADLRGEVSIPPSGAGLPLGRGTAAEGASVYAGQCVACHGDTLQGG